MFGLSTVKLVIFAVIAAAVLALMGTASYYHSQWVDAEKTIATQGVEISSAKLALQACSEATAMLQKQTEEKTEAVRNAQAQAAIIAKNNKAIADRVLSWAPGSSDECAAVKKLHQDYKAQVSAGK